MVLKINDGFLKKFLEKGLLREMKKRGYWKSGEEPDHDWNKYEGEDILEICLKKTLFEDETEFNKHIEVLKKCVDEYSYYEADDCARHQFVVPILLGDRPHGHIKLLFSHIKYSYFHKEEDGFMFSMDAFAFIDFKTESFVGGIFDEVPSVLNIEKEVWDAFRVNDFTM